MFPTWLKLQRRKKEKAILFAQFVHRLIAQVPLVGPTCIFYKAEEIFDFHGQCLTFSFLLK